MATRCSEKEALKRKTRNDKSANATEYGIKGSGRTKMQTVAARPLLEENVYVVTPLQSEVPLRTLH